MYLIVGCTDEEIGERWKAGVQRSDYVLCCGGTGRLYTASCLHDIEGCECDFPVGECIGVSEETGRKTEAKKYRHLSWVSEVEFRKTSKRCMARVERHHLTLRHC